MLLGINIDHVATLRQARLTPYPDPIEAAILAEKAGADSITLHLREDRRHIQDDDVLKLKKKIGIPINLEMALTEEMISIAAMIKPEFCCIVPEKRQELTTEGGLDVINQKDKIKKACDYLQDLEIRVSLFIDADVEQISAARETGAKAIEVHTGHYADAENENKRKKFLEDIIKCVNLGIESDFQVNAGHGLNYDNVREIAKISGIKELNIGHSIIAKSVFIGLENAVKEMKELLKV